MADMTYVQVEKAGKEAIVFFPVAFDRRTRASQPIGVSTYGAYINAKMVKMELEKKSIQAVIATITGA